jgi:hypothetical protein
LPLAIIFSDPKLMLNMLKVWDGSINPVHMGLADHSFRELEEPERYFVRLGLFWSIYTVEDV